ncbi:MAG: LPD38 domain-containing protein [Pseudomonadota bacterium]
MGWRDAPLVNSGPSAGSWRDAPLVDIDALNPVGDEVEAAEEAWRDIADLSTGRRRPSVEDAEEFIDTGKEIALRTANTALQTRVNEQRDTREFAAGLFGPSFQNDEPPEVLEQRAARNREAVESVYGRRRAPMDDSPYTPGEYAEDLGGIARDAVSGAGTAIQSLPDIGTQALSGVTQALPQLVANQIRAMASGPTDTAVQIGSDIAAEALNIDSPRRTSLGSIAQSVAGSVFEDAAAPITEDAARRFAEASERIEARTADLTGTERFAFDVTRGFVELGLAVGASAATRSPTVGSAMIASNVFGQEFGEAMRSGRTEEQAFRDASFAAIAEFVPTDRALRVVMEPGGHFFSRVGRSAFAEGVQESVTEAIQSGYQAGVLHQDMTWGEALQRMGYAGLVGGVVGGSVGGTLASLPRRNAPGEVETARAAIEPTQEDIDSPLDTDLIVEGQRDIAGSEATDRADRILSGNGMPQVGASVQVDDGEGGVRVGRIADAFEQPDGQGVRIEFDDGTAPINNYFDDLADAGISVEAIDDSAAEAIRFQQELADAGYAFPQPADETLQPEDLLPAPIQNRDEPEEPQVGPQSFMQPVQGRITSQFGMRNHPTLGGRRMHNGVDIAAPTGTPINSPLGGRVVSVGRAGANGNRIVIDHGNGLRSVYSHLSGFDVEAGQIVERGQQIGRVGSTGRSTGPHLHWTVYRNGEAVDPMGLVDSDVDVAVPGPSPEEIAERRRRAEARVQRVREAGEAQAASQPDRVEYEQVEEFDPFVDDDIAAADRQFVESLPEPPRDNTLADELTETDAAPINDQNDQSDQSATELVAPSVEQVEITTEETAIERPDAFEPVRESAVEEQNEATPSSALPEASQRAPEPVSDGEGISFAVSGSSAIITGASAGQLAAIESETGVRPIPRADGASVIPARLLDTAIDAATATPVESGGDGDGAVSNSAALPQVRDYAVNTRGSLQPERVAAALDISEAEAARALGRLAGQGEIRQARSGKFTRLPQRRGPQDLFSFIGDLGGIRPSGIIDGRIGSDGREIRGHNLRSRGFGDVFIPGSGPLLRNDGRTIDELAERVWEAGYINTGRDRPSEAEVLELIERALGERIYPESEANYGTQEASTEVEDRAEARAIFERELNAWGITEKDAGYNAVVAQGGDILFETGQVNVEEAVYRAEIVTDAEAIQVDPDSVGVPFDETDSISGWQRVQQPFPQSEASRDEQGDGTSRTERESSGSTEREGVQPGGDRPPSPEGQTDLLGEPVRQPRQQTPQDDGLFGELPEQTDAEQQGRNEIEARQQQEKSRRGGPQSEIDAQDGGLFEGEQGDIEQEGGQYEPPPLGRNDGSWFIVSRETGEAVTEMFRDSRAIYKLNSKKYRAVPAQEYLASLNDRDDSEPDRDSVFAADTAIAENAESLGALEQRLAQRLRKMKIRDKVALSVVNRIVGKEKAAGRYQSARIMIAADVPQDTEFTLNHETIHALKDLGLFKRAEWTALEKAARRDKKLMASIAERYRDLNREQRIEEAVADMFANRRAEAKGFVRTALQRIVDVMDSVRSLMTGAGVTARQVMRAVEVGEVGDRGVPTPSEVQDSAAYSIMERIGDRSEGEQTASTLERVKSAIAIFNDPETGERTKAGRIADNIRTALQDRVIKVRRLEETIARTLGRPLTDSERAYLAEELQSGRTGSRLERLQSRHVEPLFEDIQERDITLEELESFLYAMHAPERNAQIARINPDMPDGGSGMTDVEARAIISRAKKQGKHDDLMAVSERVWAMLREAEQTRVDAGLLSDGGFDNEYQHYVPLRGIDELASINFGGSGVSVAGAESKRALGRRSQAEDIIAYAIMQGQESIVRAEKNKVGQALHELYQAHPDQDFWTLDKISSKRRVNPTTGQVESYTENRIAAEDADYTVSFKIDGQEHRITLNRKNERARDVAAALLRLDDQQMGAAVRMLGGLNRWLSFANTSLNPEFTITNAFRDVQTAAVNLQQYDIDKITRGTLKDWKAALSASVRGSFAQGANRNARTDMDTWYEEFVEEGGRVYFNQIEDIGLLQKRIANQIAEMNAEGASPAALRLHARAALRATRDFIENANIGVENAVRLAAYKNAREGGMSKMQAASLAKNLTVNFNRRGTAGPLVNAGYLFYNASVQGNVILLKAMRNKKVRRLLGGIVVSSMLIDMMNAAISDDDEDGESFYDKIPEYVKSRNLVVMVPGGANGRYIAFPLPYGYNIFHHLGRAASELSRGRPFMPTAGALVTTMVDSFNPVGGTETLLNFMAPTFADPIVDLYATNRDFTDRPIMPDQSPYGPPVPDNQRYWGSVGPHWRAITDFLNEASGGDEVRPGTVDVSPETLEYMFSFITGAAGSFLNRNVNLVANLAAGEETTASDWPMVRRLTGDAPAWYDRSAYYDRVARIEQAIDNAEDYADRGDREGFEDLVDDAGELLRLEPLMKESQREMRRIRRARREIEEARERDRITEDVYRERADAIEEAETVVVDRFNRAYIEAVPISRR